MTSTTELSHGSELDLHALRAGHGGVMVGRHDGCAVFVAGALPGESVRVRITDDRNKRFRRGEVIEVLEASDHRVGMRCEAAAHGAGCCDLAFVDDVGASEIKSTVVRDLFTRMGGIDEALLDSPIHRLSPTHRWRIRTRLPVAVDGEVGVYQRGGSDIIVGYPCAQLDPDLTAAINHQQWPANAEAIAAIGDDDQPHLGFSTTTPGTTRRGSARARAQRRRARTGTRTVEMLSGPRLVYRHAHGRTWHVPIDSFWQGHRNAAAAYGNLAAELISHWAPDAHTVWDLYGGVGVFTAAVLGAPTSVNNVAVVESVASATSAGRITFADDDRVEFVTAPVAGAVNDLPTPDVVIADPPRTGAGRGVIDAMTAAAPRLIVHVGCDPATAARDLRDLSAAGYRPVAVHVVDAFGLTHHVETITALISVD